MEEEGYKAESDAQMAVRLMRTLDYQQQMRSLKQRYILERWPENFKKYKMLGFHGERCVPERDLREEKDIFDIKSLVEESIEALCGYGRNESKSFVLSRSLEPSSGKFQEISDLEIIKNAPSMLCSLNKKALKILLYTLTGRQLTSKHRYIFEREIKAAFVKLAMPSSDRGLPESLLKVASVVRNPSSYRHALGSTNPHVKLFSTMPSSALAAAHEAFSRVGNLPTRIVVEVGKLLTMEDNTKSTLSFRHKTHIKTVEAVNEEVKRALDHLKEGDPLPACLEGALQVISLSARVLFGNDGGLAGLLRPLSPEKLTLENDFQAAYKQLEKMEAADLSRICSTLRNGLEEPPKRKQQCLYELQQILIDSMHCIYAFGSVPENVAKAISMIKDTSQPATKEVMMECKYVNNRVEETATVHRLCKKGQRHKRSRAEIDAVLDVSAQFQSTVWEFYESFYGCGLNAAEERNNSTAINDAEPSIMNVDPTEAKVSPTLPSSNAEVDTHAVKIEVDVIVDDEGPKEAATDCTSLKPKFVCQNLESYVQDVEAFSDEAAIIVYVLIGCLLKDILEQHSLFLDTAVVDYLQTGLNKLQQSSVIPSNLPGAKILPASSEHVLGIAKKLKGIPQR
eukprot:c20272_g2_i1 orf=56-1927(+)